MKKGTRVQINSNGEYYAGGYDGRTGVILQDDDYPWTKLDTGEVINANKRYLTPVEPSIDNLMVGDVIEKNKYLTFKVLFIGNDNHISLSTSYDHGVTGSVWTKSELKKGFTTINPSTNTILTKQEIATKFGISEDNMEIK